MNAVERSLPGPGAGPLSTRHPRNGPMGKTGPYVGIRTRRLLEKTLMAIWALGVVGVWLGIVPDPLKFLGATIFPSVDSIPLHNDAVHDPGVVIATGGVWVGDKLGEDRSPRDTATETPPHDPSPISTWGVDLKTDRFLAGLTPWPPKPPVDDDSAPLSVLGPFADNIYNAGPLTLPEYTAQLDEFVTVAFHKKMVPELKAGLRRYLEDEGQPEAWDKEKNVWQTDSNTRFEESTDVRSWRGGDIKAEGWKSELLTDPGADAWVAEKLKGSRIEMMWQVLPSGILRSDTLRYLLLLLEGGIYSDTDTNMVKTPASWGRGAKLWKGGEGWLSEAQSRRIDNGEDIDSVLGKPSVVVGVEADVGDREDWFDWWPRPIQIAQWTMAAAPHHPITLSAVLRILHATANAVEWSHTHATQIRHLRELGRYEDSQALLDTDVMAVPTMGGPVGVMDWTGPGVWTDAMLSYVRVKYGMQWTDLKDIRQPLRVGDVVILPVTGFSPNVGNFGSEASWHWEAMVEHKFRGSWKDGKDK